MDNAIQILPGGGEIRNLPALIGDITKFAAQYVRMSTEHQKYSIENQSFAIAEYAHRNGLTIVRTYADKGKSGLTIKGRNALKQLIKDVLEGDAPFRFILVFDVSRWGRFQDADESAYYEYACKAAGLQVRYCTEQFENDGSLSATLLKNIKRLMAGEYSRELSAKIFAAKCRLTTLGFRQGGSPGYGLRRLLIDENRRPKFQLAAGERKAIHSDRILLVPGPEHEVEVVRDIFKLFVSRGKRQTDIASFLNAKGLLNEMGRPWRYRTVHQILINEKYIGNNVYNCESFKLRKIRVQNPPDMWVRADNSFAPLIEKSTFYAARRILSVKSKRLSNEDALARLRSCFRRHGCLTTSIIDRDEETPCSVTYQNKFGTLRRACELVGCSLEVRRSRSSCELFRTRLSGRKTLLGATIEVVQKAGCEIKRKAGVGSFVVDGCVTVSTKVISSRETPTSPLGWDLRVGSVSADLIVAARIESERPTFLDYYLVPMSKVKRRAYIRLASKRRLRWEEYRHTSLDALPSLIRKMKKAASRKETRRASGTRNAP